MSALLIHASISKIGFVPLSTEHTIQPFMLACISVTPGIFSSNDALIDNLNPPSSFTSE